MTTATMTPAVTSPKLASVRAVEIFQSGVHRDKQYTRADLDCMVENFGRLQDTLKPTVVIGHSEDQSFLEDSGIPAAGRVERIWRDGDTLKADFCEVPQTIARLINGRAYKSVSSEVYDDYQDSATGQHHGKTLRRVALLGGELPQIKTLADLPLADYSERPARTATLSFRSKLVRPLAGTVAYFSEIHPVSKRSKKAKFSDAVKKTYQAFADEPAMPEEAAPAPAGVSRDDMVAMLTEMGYDPAMLEKAPDELLAEMIRVQKSSMAPMADAPLPGTVNAEPPPIAPTPTIQPSSGIPGVPDRTPSQVTLKFGEKDMDLDKALAPLVASAVAAALKPIAGTLAATKSDVDKFQETTRRSAIDAKWSEWLKAGKVLPAQEEAIKARLRRADAVQKFSDGKTELEVQLAEIDAYPSILKFSETVKSKKNGAGTEEQQKVERFAEDHADALKRMGKTVSAYVTAFADARKKRPELTAAEYGVPASYAQ